MATDGMAEQLMEDLLAAVQDCDLQEIEVCLDAGASVSSPGLIHECVSTDDLQVGHVHVFHARACVCYTVPHSEHARAHLCDTAQLQIVTALLSRGAQVNQRDADGRTPLHCAQSRGVAEVLLRAGADVRARDANGLTPVEERRAFGVRGLNEVADFIAGWSGKTDLRPRNMDEILKEERAIRDEISRLQSAVSQMSARDDMASPSSPEDEPAEIQGAAPTAASLQREEYALARGLPPTATWDQITAYDAAQRRSTATKTASKSPQDARAAGETSPPAFHSRDRLSRSPPPSSESQVHGGQQLDYDFDDGEAAALSTDARGKSTEDASPFAARTELPRSPRRRDSAGLSSFSEVLQATDEERTIGPPSLRAHESTLFPTRSVSLQRSDSGGSSPGSARGMRTPRSPIEREQLLATVEALAATEAEVEASVEEAEAAAAEAEARSVAATARADVARKRARLEARRATVGLGYSASTETSGGSGRDGSSGLQLSPHSRPATSRERSGSGDPKVMIPTDMVELLRSCACSEVMTAAHRRISESELQPQNWQGDNDMVLGAYSAFFRFVAQLTRLQRSSDQSALWEMLRQTVDDVLPQQSRWTGSGGDGSRRQLDDYKRSPVTDYAVGSRDRTGSFGETSSRTGSGASDLGTSGRSRSAIDDSSAARRAELRRLTQNLVTSATDRTAAALRESGLSVGTGPVSSGSVGGIRSSNAGGNATTRASVDLAGTTWRTPGGLEYSISPPARTDSGGSDGAVARQFTLGGLTSPTSRLRTPPLISSAERRQRQTQRAQQQQEHISPGGALSPPIERATAAVTASASALRSASPQHRSQTKVRQEQLQATNMERQPVTPTPGKAWIEIEETPLRPPPTQDGTNSGVSGYSAAIGGPNDDPFAGQSQRQRDLAADSAEEQRDRAGDEGGGDSISVSQLRSNLREHLDPSSSPFDSESGTPGGQNTAPEESEQLSVKREKVLQIRRERQLAKQQAEARAREKAEQALRDKQMREARQERRLSEKEHRIAEVKAAKVSKASAAKKRQPPSQSSASGSPAPVVVGPASDAIGLEGQTSADDTGGHGESATVSPSATMPPVV